MKLTLRVKYLLDVKLSPLDGDELIVKKGGILFASVELLLGKFLNLPEKLSIM